MTDREAQVKAAAARLSFRLPGLKKSIGAGDVIRKMTDALGIEHCSECDRRKERMNRLLRFNATLEEGEVEHEH